jgi:hypothetical protein
MSSSSPGMSSLALEAALPLAELTVTDAEHRVVADGVGSLREQLPAGVYEIRWRTGTTFGSRLVDLRSGDPYEARNLRVPVESAAPVAGTSTTNAAHEDAAHEASAELSVAGEDAGLIVMVRGLSPEGTLEPAEVHRVVLRDTRGNALELPWAIDPWRRFAIASVALRPGQHSLRAPRRGLPKRLEQTLEQSLWLPIRHKTLLFVPVDETGTAFARASVHLIDADDAWDPRAPTTLAVEQLHWELADGMVGSVHRAAVARFAADRLPMAELIAAHLELRRAEPHLGWIRSLLERLEDAVPGHPDLLALKWILLAQERDAGPSPPPLWEIPMLRAGYEGAVEADARLRGVLADGSAAVTISGRRFVEGIWTAWHPSAEVEPTGKATGDPATRRVERYLDVFGVGDTASASDVAASTGLPAGAVARALTDLGALRRSDHRSSVEPERPAVPRLDDPPTKLERVLSRLLVCLAAGFALVAVLSVVLALTLPSDAAILLAILGAARSTGLGMALRYAAADVRRRGALLDLIGGALLIEAGAVLLLSELLRTDDLSVHDASIDGHTLAPAIAAADLAVALVMHAGRAIVHKKRWRLRVLSASAHRTVAAIAELLRLPDPPLPPDEVALNADVYLARMQRAQKFRARMALRAVTLSPLALLRPPFPSVHVRDRQRAIESLFARSRRVPLLGAALRIGHQLAALGYYSDLRVWRWLGLRSHSGESPAPLQRSPIPVATRPPPAKDEVVSAEAVVVGSGVSGALLAYRLAERGLRTLILERAAVVDPVGATDSTLRSLPELDAEDAFSVLREFDMRVVQTASTSGSTDRAFWSADLLQVVRRWNDDLDAGIDLERFEAALERVERWLPGAGRPAGALSTAVQRFAKGAAALGLDHTAPASPESVPRDLSANSAAAFDTLIPWGQRRFGDHFEVLPRCTAKRVIVEQGAVSGVECRCDGRKLRIEAPTVVIAAGALRSSEILRESHIGRNVGRRLSFDLSASMTADFVEKLDAFDGVQLATAVNLDGQEFVAETLWGDPASQALAMPGWFGQHTANMRRYRHMLAVRVHFGVDRTGEDELLPLRRPSGNVRLRKPELRQLLDRLVDVGRILFAADAERVMPHTLRYYEYRAVDELTALRRDVTKSSEISVLARPQGGNPISGDPTRGVVGPDLAVHGHPGLLVCDASVFPGAVLRNPRLVSMALAEHAAAMIAL